MLPADGILRAAQRWLRLLERSTFAQAAALVRSDAVYTDLSQTQYASALEWLLAAGLVSETEHGLVLAAHARRADGSALIFAKALELAAPSWLPDADVLVPDAGELPADAANAADILGLSGDQAFLTVRQVHGHIDLAERARVGAAGELALIRVLESGWPGSTRHASLDDDGLGYDIEFTCDGIVWHIEVKSTTRRGRLSIHLSRHEHEVARLDARWRLVTVGLNSSDQAAAIATATSESLINRCPKDSNPASRWDSVSHEMSPADLQPGLKFVGMLPMGSVALDGVSPTAFAWMPPSH